MGLRPPAAALLLPSPYIACLELGVAILFASLCWAVLVLLVRLFRKPIAAPIPVLPQPVDAISSKLTQLLDTITKYGPDTLEGGASLTLIALLSTVHSGEGCGAPWTRRSGSDLHCPTSDYVTYLPVIPVTPPAFYLLPRLFLFRRSASTLRHSSAVFALTTLLKLNTHILRLDLSDTGLYSPGARTLASSLMANATLTHLILKGNMITDDGATSLAKVLSLSSTLRSLELEQTGLTDRAVPPLGRALAVNRSLTSLNVAWNRVTMIRPISDALCDRNSSLTALYLGGNTAGDKKASFLSKVLWSNTSLRTLGMECSGMTDKGATDLAMSLPVNSTLTSLDLRCNKITAHGVGFLSAAIQNNTTLARLCVILRVPEMESDDQQPLAQTTDCRRLFLQFLVMCAVRHVEGSAGLQPLSLVSLPADIVVCIARQMTYLDFERTPRQLGSLSRFVFNNAEAVCARVRAKRRLTFIEGWPVEGRFDLPFRLGESETANGASP